MTSVGRAAIDTHLPLIREMLSRHVPQSPTAEVSFPDLLAKGVMNVNAMQQDAQSKIHEMLTGGDVSQAELVTAVQKADMAFRLLLQVRNKLLAAYEQINQIHI